MLKSENVQVKESFLSIGSIKCFSPLATSRRSLACCCFMVSRKKGHSRSSPQESAFNSTVALNSDKKLHRQAQFWKDNSAFSIWVTSFLQSRLLTSMSDCLFACWFVCMTIYSTHRHCCLAFIPHTKKSHKKKHKNLHSNSKVRTDGGWRRGLQVRFSLEFGLRGKLGW